jgi:formylglycine-generating enzyme required for sulfatase activity
VSWFDVQRFLVRLSGLSGHRLRLPTEAEWEYACRAGTSGAFSTGAALSAEQANYDGRYPLPGGPAGRYRGAPVPVRSFAPNALGLYDMHGNVWEWCQDEFCPYPAGPAVDPVGRCGATLRVIRGGSWAFDADSARCALRYTHRPQDSGYSLGFRLVRPL